MSRLATKNRTVTFRVSEEEFDALRELCRTVSAPSVSELARAAVRGLTLNGTSHPRDRTEVTADLQCSPLGSTHRFEKIAQSDLPVLIDGETGVGKTTLAEQLHAFSSRACLPMVQLDCSVLEPADVLSGFERAQNTTLLLKEVGLTNRAAQAAMLEPLLRAAGQEPGRCPIRIIATTRVHLDSKNTGSGFREDLYYQFNVLRIRLRPLRERKDDILPLARQFLGKQREGNTFLSPAVAAALIRYPWPGNLRELDNVMRAFAVTHDPGILFDRLEVTKAEPEQRA
jgi:DNA-binding NtrC family response regulator